MSGGSWRQRESCTEAPRGELEPALLDTQEGPGRPFSLQWLKSVSPSQPQEGRAGLSGRLSPRPSGRVVLLFLGRRGCWAGRCSEGRPQPPDSLLSRRRVPTGEGQQGGPAPFSQTPPCASTSPLLGQEATWSDWLLRAVIPPRPWELRADSPHFGEGT